MAVKGHGAGEAPHAGEADIVAALGLQLHIVAETCRERLRPGAGRHDDGVVLTLLTAF